MLRAMLGSALHQEKATYGFGYKQTLTRNIDNSVLSKADTTNKAKFEIDDFEWYVPRYA